MTATKELRRLLDERGVKWRTTPHYSSESDDNETVFDGNGLEWYAREFSNDHVELRTARLIVTPVQAVEATVGRGTCHTVSMDCFGNPPYNQSGLSGNDPACGCSECGAPWSSAGLFRGNKLRHNFKACPICGRKVVES